MGVPLRTALLVLAALGAVGGLAGAHKGWAYARRSLAPTEYAPEMSIELRLGWWSSVTHIQTGFIPIDLDVEGKSIRALGGVTALGLGLAAAAALLLLTSELCGARLHFSRLHLGGREKCRAAGGGGWSALVLTALLYAVMLFKAHSEIKQHAGAGVRVDVWPRPDWSCASAAVSGLCLLGAAASFNAESRLTANILDGYLPL